MKEIEKQINELKSYLKENLTTENVNFGVEIDKKLDKLLEENKIQEEKLNKANETLLNLVKNTSFKPTEEDKIQEEDKVLSVDEALQNAINLVENKHK